MKTIIVPTDFSETSVNAAHYAAALAGRLQADIQLLHVLPLPLTIAEVPIPLDSIEISLEEADKSLHVIKEALEKQEQHTINITCKATTNSFQEEMEEANRQTGTFAVVMGTSGAGNAEAFFLGSFSLTAAKYLSLPLIVVPPGYHFKAIEKIGLACDMRNVSDTLPFDSIRSMIKQFGTRLEVLYVSKSDEKMYPQVLSETRFVQNTLAGLRPEFRITTNSDIKEGLEDFVRQHAIDLLLLIPKERGFTESIFHKSMTKKMALHAEVPVMILH